MSSLLGIVLGSFFCFGFFVVIGFPRSEYLSESLIMMKEDTAFECVFSVSIGLCSEYCSFKGIFVAGAGVMLCYQYSFGVCLSYVYFPFFCFIFVWLLM